MKFLLLLMYHICSTYVLANNDAECTIDSIPDETWKGQLTINIDDNVINQPIFTSKYNGSIDHIVCTNIKKFFAVDSNSTDFIIKTTTDMESFDEETAKTYRKFATETFKCLITCKQSSTPSTLNIFVKITDVNTHPPNFYNQDYTFLVASPLMPMTDFSVYGNPIVVKDLDFSNQDVTFTVVPDDFEIKTRTTADSKYYTALFYTRKPIQIIEDRVYKVTATDSGDYHHSQSSTVTITLKSNPSSSIDFPSFKQDMYQFDYRDVEGSKLALRDGDEIKLKTNKPKYLSDKSFKLDGILSTHFIPVYNSSSQTVTFKVENMHSTYTILISTLTVESDTSGSTTIIIYMPLTYFSSSSYIANYNQTDQTITVNPAIKVVSRSGTPVVRILSGEHADSFQIIYNNITNFYDVSLSEGHSIDDLGNIDSCRLFLVSTLGDSSSRALLHIALPKHELKFVKPLYIASYDAIDKNIDFDTDNLMAFTTEVDNVTISIDQGYTDYFSVQYNYTEQKCEFKVIDELPKDTLEAGKDITIMINAEDKYKNKDQCYVKVVLPLISSLLEFSSASYEVDYPSTGNGNIDLPIQFINPKDLSQVSVTPTCDTIQTQEYFSIEKQESDQFVMNLTKKLPDEIMQRPSLVLTLVAEMSYAETTSILVMNMPTKAKERAIEFGNLLYTGTLEDGKLSVDKIVMITNETDSKVWTSIKESKYSKYFQASYQNRELTVSVSKSAPEKELKAIRSTLLTLSVGINDTTDQTSAVLSIESKIPDNIDISTDENTGTYAVAVWVLAVTLVVFVIGSAVFYKLKIRNLSTSTSVDLDDVGYVRFDKRTKKQSSGPIEGEFSDVSQRRPTRFFNPLNEEISREINDDNEAREGRKSVAFDEIVQQLQINQEGDLL